MDKAIALQNLSQAMPRIVSYMLVAVAARHRETVHRLDNSPSYSGVVRSPYNQRAARFEYPLHFGEQRLVVGYMLDHLRVNHAVESLIAKRQVEGRRAQERYPKTAEEAHLAHTNIHADRIVEALNNQARTASDIQNSACATRPQSGYAMAAALPITLNRNEAVKRAVVIVGRFHRVSQHPQPERRPSQIQPEAYQPGMRTAGFARKVRKRHLEDAETLRVCLDQDFFEHLEVAPLEVETGERLAPVEPKATRHISDRHRESPAHRDVQHAAQELSHERGIGDAAPCVARSDYDVRLLARTPKFRDEVRLMRLIGIERQHIVTARLAETGLERSRITTPALGDDARPVLARHALCVVGRATVHHDNLESQPLAVHQRAHPRDEHAQILALVDDRQNNREVHRRFRTFMWKLRQREQGSLGLRALPGAPPILPRSGAAPPRHPPTSGLVPASPPSRASALVPASPPSRASRLVPASPPSRASRQVPASPLPRADARAAA